MKLEDFRVIDLTHAVTANMPVWPGDPAMRIKKTADLLQQGYYLNRLSLGEHSGTHVGAPRHFLENGADMAAIPVDRLFLPAVKLDVRPIAGDRNPFLVKTDQIVDWESHNGAIPSGCIVLLHTGWSDYWHDAERYWGPHFPGITPEAAELLVRERGVKAVGIDSPGIDGAASTDYAANKILAAGGALHLENLTNLRLLSQRGAWIFIGALPINGGSGSPARVIALEPVK